MCQKKSDCRLLDTLEASRAELLAAAAARAASRPRSSPIMAVSDSPVASSCPRSRRDSSLPARSFRGGGNGVVDVKGGRVRWWWRQGSNLGGTEGGGDGLEDRVGR